MLPCCSVSHVIGHDGAFLRLCTVWRGFFLSFVPFVDVAPDVPANSSSTVHGITFIMDLVSTIEVAPSPGAAVKGVKI